MCVHNFCKDLYYPYGLIWPVLLLACLTSRMLIVLIQSVVMSCHDAIMPAVLNDKYKSNVIRLGKK